MKRREFIKTTAIIGAGFAVGIHSTAHGYSGLNRNINRIQPCKTSFVFPYGGCTESTVTLFDKGPSGKDPFNIFQ